MKMKKKNFIKSLVSVMSAVCMLFIYSQTVDANSWKSSCPQVDCGDYDEDKCWLSATYRITLETAGVIDTDDESETYGLEEWTYGITKRTGWSPKAEFLMGLEKDLIVSVEAGDFDELYDPCEPETFGVGDCLRQYLKWNNIKYQYEITFFVKPTGTTSTLPIFVKKGLLVGAGSILGPAAALEVKNTFFVDETGDGRALAIRMDRNGNIVEAEICPPANNPDATCENYPDNFVPFDENNSFELEETYFCIPAREPEFPANYYLTPFEVANEVINNSESDSDEQHPGFHCGYLEFKDEGSSVVFKNRGRCKKIGGKLFCY